MLVSILSNIMIFNIPQCAGFDEVCATKAVWSWSCWLDKQWKHFVPWPSFQYGLSLSLSPNACTHIQSILMDSLGKKCIWTTLHLTYRCVLFHCYFKCLISIGRIIVNHWFGLFFQCVYHAYAWALWENYSGRWCGWRITHSWTNPSPIVWW